MMRSLSRWGLGALALAGLAAALAEPALAQTPAATPPKPNSGDTAFVLISAYLVLMMTIPGLALFYGGLVRQKNMLSMLMQVSTVTVMNPRGMSQPIRGISTKAS